MTVVRGLLIWAGVALAAAATVLLYTAIVIGFMWWPLRTLTVLTVLTAASIAALHLTKRRLDRLFAGLMRAGPQQTAAPETTPAPGASAIDPLREILGAELYDELAALDSVD